MHFSSLVFKGWLIGQKGLIIFQMYFQEQTTMEESQLDMTESPFLSTQQTINDLHLQDSGPSNHKWVNYFSLAIICITISLIILMAFKLWKQKGLIKKLQEESKPNPAEQHYENNEIALYNNTHASVAFSPNPYYGDN